MIERIQKSDVIFLCVPIFTTAGWLLKYKKHLKGKVIIEQCSLKSDLYDNKITKGLDIRGMHIMFRPSQTPVSNDRNVGLILPHFTRAQAIDIEKLTQSRVHWYNSVAQHDEVMAKEQALIHRVLLTLALQLNGYTYVSRKVKDLAIRISEGDLELYTAIQNNRQLPKMLKRFDKRLKTFDINNYMC